MKHRAATLAVAAAIGWGTGAQAVPVTTENTDLIINTKSGLEVKTVDKKFSFKVGGRIQVDQNLYEGSHNFSTSDPDNSGDWADELFFRRVRLELAGTAYYDWRYEFVTDFREDNSTVSLQDVWLGFDSTRLLDFESLTRAGKFKPYFGLEELTSSKWIPLIERSNVTQFFAAGRKIGFGTEAPLMDMFTMGGSYFKENSSLDSGKDDGGDLHGYSVRGTFSPWHEEGKVAHLGVSYQMRELRQSSIGIRQEVREADQLSLALDGGNQMVDLSVIGLESLGIFGPFSLQGEYFTGWLDPQFDQIFGSDTEDELDAWGFHVIGRWTITGESLPYDFKKGAPGQIKPYGKWGAFEMVARYSSLEIEDIIEAMLDTYTVGFNWYVNNNVRLALNYVHTELDGDAVFRPTNMQGAGVPMDLDEGDAVAIRAQYQF